MRGTEEYIDITSDGAGITPADAGNRKPLNLSAGAPRDHPRGCGEQHVRVSEFCGPVGSPPRMRGTDDPDARSWLDSRITPADAGNRRPRQVLVLSSRDHPRGCGEQNTRRAWRIQQAGSPPRMRGTGSPFPCSEGSQGITPADAGNSAACGKITRACRDHPRGCGEQASKASANATGSGSPPRMRGTGRRLLAHGMPQGITPADAGNRLRNPKPCLDF